MYVCMSVYLSICMYVCMYFCHKGARRHERRESIWDFAGESPSWLGENKPNKPSIFITKPSPQTNFPHSIPSWTQISHPPPPSPFHPTQYYRTCFPLPIQVPTTQHGSIVRLVLPLVLVLTRSPRLPVDGAHVIPPEGGSPVGGEVSAWGVAVDRDTVTAGPIVMS
jgi:hypothetical protein